MIISHSRRFIFFSNPKTGSESVRALLADCNEETVVDWRRTSRLYPFYPHMPPTEAREVFRAKGWDFDSYRRITAIRNPYPRLVSLYRMIMSVDGYWGLRRRLGQRVPDFQDWLHTTRPDGPGGGGRIHQRWRKFGAWSAYHWTHDAQTNTLVTDILRLEDFGSELPSLLKSIGVTASATVPAKNQRPPVDWRDWYDARSEALVAHRYAWDLSNFYDLPAKKLQHGQSSQLSLNEIRGETTREALFRIRKQCDCP